MTVSARHGIKLNGILDLLEDLPANARKNLRIVFVLPLDNEETRLFKCQSITYPQGVSDKDIALVAHMYIVYRSIHLLRSYKVGYRACCTVHYFST